METQAPNPQTSADTVPPSLTDRLFSASLGALDLAGVYLGDRLGLYRGLAEGGAATRLHATKAGVAGQIDFRRSDAAMLEERADVALIIEAVHDMSDPVAVLSAIRRNLAPDASLIVVDEHVAESFTAPGDDVERFMYGWSITTCLPDGRSRSPSVATGTVMRPATLGRYARDAGFGSFDVLPVQNDFFRFY